MSSELDPAKLKVVDLRNELAARGLDQKGVKAVLVKRLKDYLDKESESKGGKSENVVTKSEETPRKSARKSADEKEEVKSSKAPPTAEKAKPQEKVDKPPQEKPAPAKPDETPKASQKSAENSSSGQLVSNKVTETNKKEDTPIGQSKTAPKPKDESLDKAKVDVKSPEKPKTEVKRPESTPAKGKPAGDAKIETKSPEKPKSEVKHLESSPVKVKPDTPKNETKSPDKQKNETKSQEKPKMEAKSPDKPKTEAKSPEKPKSEIKSTDKIKSDVKEPEKPKNEDAKQEKSKSDETSEKPKAEESDGDSPLKKAKLDDTCEEKDQPTPMEVHDEPVKSKRTESRSEHRGEKRKRSGDGDSPDRSPKRQKTPPEDEPEIDINKVQLSWYDSDLHLVINKSTFLSAKPLNEGAFGYAWAGARATHGVSSGKVYYEVKITDKLKWEDFSLPIERFRLDKNKRDDRRHSRRSDNKSGRKGDEKSKEKSDKKEKKQDTDPNKKEESMEVGESNTNEEKPAEDNKETNSETNEKKSDEKVETEEKSDEKVDTEEKSEEKMETDDEQKSEEKDNEDEKDVEEENDNEENDDVEKEKDSEEKDEKDGEEKNNDEKEKDSKDEKKKVDENKDKKPEVPPLPTHFIRIGWSITKSSLQLGEDKNSYAYESSGNFVKNKEFVAYGVPFDAGSVVGAYLDISDDIVTIRFAVNGELQPAIEIPKSELPENFALFPHVLSRNYEFEVNFGEKEEPLVGISSELEGYNFISKVENKVSGLKRPETRSDCEVLLMCGLPASGKTQWVNEHVETNPDKNYTILGNNSILDKMTVSGEPLKSKYKGKWGVLIDRIQKCLNKLVSTAALRRRNYIIDQTNVFASAQSRKMRPFEGFKRKAVIVVVGDEEQARRQALKEVPDSTILGMKAAMVLPAVGDWLEEVSYVGVEEKEAKEIIKKYNEAGRAAGFPADKRRDNRRSDQGRHFQRRSGYQQSYQSSRRWEQRRDGSGSTWKHDSRSREWRGSSYNPRPRDYYSQGSYDRRRSQYGSRPSGGDWGNSGGSNWGNRNQNTGWNQQTFNRSYTQPWNNSGNQNWGKYNSGNSGGWQGYGNNWNSYGQQGHWNQK